jgi:hypothetical protein
MDGIYKEVVEWETKTDRHKATLDVKVMWRSSNFQNGKEYLEEQTRIIVHPVKEGIRAIDFLITLRGTVPGVSLGGSDDEKGYGGLCARIKMPDDLVFTSAKGSVTPQTLQVVAGPWMDFSGSLGTGGEQHGLAILCHPDTPNYPAPWILRQKRSMQNIVYPGRDPVAIPMDHPVNLKYRLILHTGNAGSLNLDKLQGEFSAVDF